jgi:hypothetical protein
MNMAGAREKLLAAVLESSDVDVQISIPDPELFSAIFHAAIANNVACLKGFIADDPDAFEVIDDSGNTVLAELVRLTIEYKIAFETYGNPSDQTWHERYLAAVSLLLNLGANPNMALNGVDAAGEECSTPILHYVIDNKDTDLLNELLSARQEIAIDCLDSKGRSALLLAVLKKAIPLMQKLLNAGANVHKVVWHEGRATTTFELLSDATAGTSKEMLKRLQQAATRYATVLAPGSAKPGAGASVVCDGPLNDK